MRPTLADLKSITYQAGKIILDSFGKDHQVQYKGVSDIVTDVDKRSEAFIIEQIRCNYPAHTIIAEESGHLVGKDEYCWYIDPLDGTTNYAHGVPIFSVSLAYAENGRVQLGVVYDPTRDECFNAEREKGAWLGNIPIHVSAESELANSLLVTGFPYDMSDPEHTNLDQFNKFTVLSQAVRRLGSAALDLCYVAAGRMDGYWEIEIGSYDIAAGALIVEEAGGVVTNLGGNPDYLIPPYSIVGANPNIHLLMMTVLQEK